MGLLFTHIGFADELIRVTRHDLKLRDDPLKITLYEI